MEGGVDAARQGQAWTPTAPRHPELTSPGGAQSEQPVLPSSPAPQPPQSGQTFPVALSWGPERAPQALLSEGRKINSRLEAADAPPTSSGLADWPRAPQATSGSCSSGALLSPSPSSPPPEAAGPEEPGLGLWDKLPSGQRRSRGFTVSCDADGPDRAPPLLSRRRRPPDLSDPAQGLRGSSSGVSAPTSARPARTLACTAPVRWMPALPDGVPAPQAPESPPAGGQSLGTRASGDRASDRKRQRRCACANTHTERGAPTQGDAGSPGTGARLREPDK
ncbi:unnamed protein product [Rangifer tarandus platyrhynchus]|uniref:Uncharacterized protein n=2 Tax=Rangifer tarandus platyrhynchus TaxID=3082113 RepID=A0ABN8ZHE0_RANTA|nr:unnamed protein product [Rangifer tarandus platyrhynchus]CAI9708750.1 unnamed protein product [Rangifer tarandus platyrhynchus]